MPSIHDVAKRAGVSPSTVSRTFGESPLISQDTRERVFQVAQELNYRPRRVHPVTGMTSRRSTARSAPSKRITIGFQFFAAGPYDQLDCNLFYAPVLSGVQAEAAASSVHLFVQTTDRWTINTGKPGMVTEPTVDGMLLVGNADREVLAAFSEHVPLILLVDTPDPDGKHPCILSDGFSGAYQATQHLIELGHQRIAFFAPETDVPSFRERQFGYLCALMDAGIPLNPEFLYVRSVASNAENESWLTEKLSPTDRPTALVAANDFYAFLTMRVCHRLQIRVPDHLSVVGFDDSRESQIWSPPLTTVRVEKEMMGRLAMRRLLTHLTEQRQAATPITACHCVMPVTLIVRESTAPPPNIMRR